MTIPSLPTDNLYKFLALTGIVVIFSLFLYSSFTYEKIVVENEVIHGEVHKLEIKKDKLQREKRAIQYKIQSLLDQCHCGDSVVINDSIISTPFDTSQTEKALRFAKITDSLIDKYNETTYQLKLNFADLETKNAIAEVHLNEFGKNFKLVLYFIGVGMICSIVGFVFWYRNTQWVQDKILKAQFEENNYNPICQSCGTWLGNYEWYNSLPPVEKGKIKYCKFCFSEDHFVDPNITIDQMIDKVRKQCALLGLNSRLTKRYIKRLKNLDRWQKRFKW